MNRVLTSKQTVEEDENNSRAYRNLLEAIFGTVMMFNKLDVDLIEKNGTEAKDTFQITERIDDNDQGNMTSETPEILSTIPLFKQNVNRNRKLVARTKL